MRHRYVFLEFDKPRNKKYSQNLQEYASTYGSYRDYCCVEVPCVRDTEPKLITQNWSHSSQEDDKEMTIG